MHGLFLEGAGWAEGRGDDEGNLQEAAYFFFVFYDFDEIQSKIIVLQFAHDNY